MKRIAFAEALKEARLSEAAHLEAILNVKDARSLRLSALRETLLPAFQDHVMAREFIDLAVQPGETPRLWIDLITSVVIEPDTRTFRLEQDREGRRELLHASDNIDEMARAVVKAAAHRVVAREKAAAGMRLTVQESLQPGYGLWELVYVWATGAALGVLALLVLAIFLGILKF